MYPENPEGVRVIVSSMKIRICMFPTLPRNRTSNNYTYYLLKVKTGYLYSGTVSFAATGGSSHSILLPALPVRSALKHHLLLLVIPRQSCNGLSWPKPQRTCITLPWHSAQLLALQRPEYYTVIQRAQCWWATFHASCRDEESNPGPRVPRPRLYRIGYILPSHV